MRMLIYHPESDSLFETTEKEWWDSPDSLDKGLCSDVTGIPEFEKRLKQDREGIDDQGEESELKEVDNITFMNIAAKRIYKHSLAEAKTISEQTEKEATHMARERESIARSNSRDVARRRAQESSHGGGGFGINLPEGVNFFKNDGKTMDFDFIPYAVQDKHNLDVIAGRVHIGDLVDARLYFQHRDIGAEQKAYVCLKSVGKKCPICEAHANAKKNATMSKDDVDALRSKERMLYNVIDCNDKDGKIMVWDVSYHLFTKLLEKEQRSREEYYDYWVPEGGYSLHIRFEEKTMGRGKPFWNADRIDFEKRKPLSDADLKAAVDLDACLQILPYEKLEAIFLGTEGDGESAPAEEPARRGVSEEAPAGRGRREPASAPEQESTPAGRGRRGEPVASATPARGGRGSEDSVHRHDPDAERAAGKHPIDPEQDGCPFGHKFGVDENKHDECASKCLDENWKACREEKDRLAKTVKPAPAKPEEPKRGRR